MELDTCNLQVMEIAQCIQLDLMGIPEWGHDIKKIECANHACKFYTLL